MWLKWLSFAEFWYNTYYHFSIATSPFEALYSCLSPIHIPYFVKDSDVFAVDAML